ncbi:hypothetical protein HH310_33905 [Actinoplanes sp. TBRC 11911]|uniref:hypothetical protein n=1 Tax=Actinoplanes sp. TBRC 11911 TaxID=2729386 RepID=UPI00145F6C9A|nr:hypothetical protein [Actinoplanes sp. TBRC 11911]NMO56160.1 hypothetical protein [Actinoplanes sp. TBRC 11911]
MARYLGSGEQPRVATRATVGAFDASRLATVLSRGIVPGIANAVTDAIHNSTGAQVVVATDQRVLFLSCTFWGGPGDELVTIVPRDLLSLAESKLGTVSVLRLSFAGGGVSLTFPRIDKAGAVALAAELRS